MKGYSINIEEATLSNKKFRKVLFTGKHMQLVVMSLKKGDDIPLEIHKTHDQFIRIEKGSAFVRIGKDEFKLKNDDAIIIPAGNWHYVKNTGNAELKLYTIYTPPEHKPGTIHKTRKEALEKHH